MLAQMNIFRLKKTFFCLIFSVCFFSFPPASLARREVTPAIQKNLIRKVDDLYREVNAAYKANRFTHAMDNLEVLEQLLDPQLLPDVYYRKMTLKVNMLKERMHRHYLAAVERKRVEKEERMIEGMMISTMPKIQDIEPPVGMAEKSLPAFASEPGHEGEPESTPRIAEVAPPPMPATPKKEQSETEPAAAAEEPTAIPVAVSEPSLTLKTDFEFAKENELKMFPTEPEPEAGPGLDERPGFEPEPVAADDQRQAPKIEVEAEPVIVSEGRPAVESQDVPEPVSGSETEPEIEPGPAPQPESEPAPALVYEFKTPSDTELQPMEKYESEILSEPQEETARLYELAEPPAGDKEPTPEIIYEYEPEPEPADGDDGTHELQRWPEPLPASEFVDTAQVGPEPAREYIPRPTVDVYLPPPPAYEPPPLVPAGSTNPPPELRPALESLYARGLRLYRSGIYIQAHKAFLQVARQWPNYKLTQEYLDFIENHVLQDPDVETQNQQGLDRRDNMIGRYLDVFEQSGSMARQQE